MEPNEIINQRLLQIEAERSVKIVFAAESGSRAWGFASPDSDYDVRFIYLQEAIAYKKQAWRKDTVKDTIEYMEHDGLYDYSGWDWLKSLGLAQKSNPALNEWIYSSIVYRNTEEGLILINLIKELWNPLALYHHYLSMAKSNFREYLQGDLIKYKKYLYVLRPILAAQFIKSSVELGSAKVPPLLFEDLKNQTLEEGSLIKEEVDKLLVLKKQVSESEWLPRNQILNDFCSTSLTNLRTENFPLVKRSEDKHFLLDNASVLAFDSR